MMTYNIVATGSRGNAVVINERILIDCGVPYYKLEPHADKIKLVLLTHSHGDHFKRSTVRKLHQLHPAIRWGCCEWMAGLLVDAGVDKRSIDVIEPTPPGGASHAVIYRNIAIVSAVPIPHDVPNCGWKIHFRHESLFYATDCSSLDSVCAENFDFYMIEANHKREEIEARIAAKRAAGEYSYELEAMRNHLSEEQALDWLAKNAGPDSRYIFLHGHTESNNTKEETDA